MAVSRLRMMVLEGAWTSTSPLNYEPSDPGKLLNFGLSFHIHKMGFNENAYHIR